MTKPRVYVAGASAEPERVRWAMDAVEAEGWEVAFDWLARIDEEGAANEGLAACQRLRAAMDCEIGVLTADAFWLLAPEVYSAGSWWELCRAYERVPHVVVSGPAASRCIFASYVQEVDTDARGLAILRSRLRRDDGRG